MSTIVQLDKTREIVQVVFCFVLLPAIVGVLVGTITARLKPYRIKLTLIIASAISIIFLGFVLSTLQNQAIPILAVIFAAISIAIMNASTVISHKVVSKILARNK